MANFIQGLGVSWGEGREGKSRSSHPTRYGARGVQAARGVSAPNAHIPPPGDTLDLHRALPSGAPSHLPNPPPPPPVSPHRTAAAARAARRWAASASTRWRSSSSCAKLGRGGGGRGGGGEKGAGATEASLLNDHGTHVLALLLQLRCPKEVGEKEAKQANVALYRPQRHDHALAPLLQLRTSCKVGWGADRGGGGAEAEGGSKEGGGGGYGKALSN